MSDTFTAADKLACIKREVDYRRFVYARRVSEGKMKQEEATYPMSAHGVPNMESDMREVRLLRSQMPTLKSLAKSKNATETISIELRNAYKD